MLLQKVSQRKKMAKQTFNCEECDADFKVETDFEESGPLQYCPFCGNDMDDLDEDFEDDADLFEDIDEDLFDDN